MANNKALTAVGEIISHKAILEIVDYKSGGSSHFANENGANTVLAKAADKLGTKVSNFLNSPSILNSAKSALGIETGTFSDGVIKVQYNPSSIKYTGATPSTSTDQKRETMDNGNTRVITTVTNSSYINMSFSLVFNSRFTTDLSVKEQMELIMNMIYDSPSRKVRFSWGNMVAEGRLVGFSGKYDMFDMTGTPISGSMDMTIRMDISESDVSTMIEEAQKEREDKQEDTQTSQTQAEG